MHKSPTWRLQTSFQNICHHLLPKISYFLYTNHFHFGTIFLICFCIVFFLFGILIFVKSLKFSNCEEHLCIVVNRVYLLSSGSDSHLSWFCQLAPIYQVLLVWTFYTNWICIEWGSTKNDDTHPTSPQLFTLLKIIPLSVAHVQIH